MQKVEKSAAKNLTTDSYSGFKKILGYSYFAIPRGL